METKQVRPPYVRLALGAVVLAAAVAAMIAGPACLDCPAQRQQHFLIAGVLAGAGAALLISALMQHRLIVAGKAVPMSERAQRIVGACSFAATLLAIAPFARPMTLCFATTSMTGDGAGRPSMSCSTESLFATPGFLMLVVWGVAFIGWLLWLRAQRREEPAGRPTSPLPA